MRLASDNFTSKYLSDVSGVPLRSPLLVGREREEEGGGGGGNKEEEEEKRPVFLLKKKREFQSLFHLRQQRNVCVCEGAIKPRRIGRLEVGGGLKYTTREFPSFL